jgi:CHAT domain-containing protein
VAEHFDDPQKAYGIVEQVRGRVTTDLLMAGSITSEEANQSEAKISQLRLKLMSAHSNENVRRIRDQIFTAQESRWASPGISILKAQSHGTVSVERVQEILRPSALMLEYIVADRRSYCVVISHSTVRIVSLPGKRRIEDVIADYVKAVKAKRPARNEARALYGVLLQPIPGINQKEDLIVIRDGQLHLVPFDALEDANGRFVIDSCIVTYVPSATSFYLMAREKRSRETFSHPLLAVGGIPYSGDKQLTDRAIIRGYQPGRTLTDLPSSRDEVLAANTAVPGPTNTLLLGTRATEAAFKHADLENYRIIHLSVHGFANGKDPDQAMLILLPDRAAGEDGFLQASEVTMLRLRADLVVLSACDTAVGPVEGQEGIETLSRAFFLAGARNVISTLWSIDDTFSLHLMKRFYAHLGTHESPAYALTAAKRDVIRSFRKQAVPYYWAGFTFEGLADRDVMPHSTVN